MWMIDQNTEHRSIVQPLLREHHVITIAKNIALTLRHNLRCKLDLVTRTKTDINYITASSLHTLSHDKRTIERERKLSSSL